MKAGGTAVVILPPPSLWQANPIATGLALQ